jgi:hypothetical protein
MSSSKNDFKSFVQEKGEAFESSSLLANIHAEIARTTPSLKKVLIKLGLVHLGASLLSLIACPQFGIGFISYGHNLMHYFMQISETYCYILCGAFYLASTIVVARFVLTFDEWLVIKRSRALMIMCLALVSLGAFALHSHEVTFELALLWLFGASLGGELVSLSKYEWKTLPRRIFTLRPKLKL